MKLEQKALMLICFILTACNQTLEEKALESASKKGSSQINTAMPDCDKRDENRRFINGTGCTEAERKAFWAKFH